MNKTDTLRITTECTQRQIKIYTNIGFEIMRARTKAKLRGATPAEIERNVLYLTVRCAICGGDTAYPSSFTGLAHKWGPADHEFDPITFD